MDDDAMRRALMEKLRNPEWKAKQEARYRQIVGEAEVTFADRPPRSRRPALPAGNPPPVEEEPGTVEALWMGNWQRSSGALTITRFPDDTVVLDHPDGWRSQFRTCPAPRGRYTWLSESSGATGRQKEVYRCPERFEDAREAVLEMHRAALAMYTEAATEMEG